MGVSFPMTVKEDRVNALEIYAAAQTGAIVAFFGCRRWLKRRWIIRDKMAYRRGCRAHKMAPWARIPRGPRKGVPGIECIFDPWEKR